MDLSQTFHQASARHHRNGISTYVHVLDSYCAAVQSKLRVRSLLIRLAVVLVIVSRPHHRRSLLIRLVTIHRLLQQCAHPLVMIWTLELERRMVILLLSVIYPSCELGVQKAAEVC